MTEKVIPKENWDNFLLYVNQHFHDSIVKVEILDDENYRIDYAESIPLKDFDLEERDEENKVLYINAGTGSAFNHQLDYAELITVVEKTEDLREDELSSMETLAMNPVVEEAILIKNPKTIKVLSSRGRRAFINFYPLDEEDFVR